MKKVILILAAVSLGTVLNAQNLSFGPTVGFGHTWANSDVPNGVDRNFYPAYSVGGKLVYSFKSNWGISADVRFSGEGQKATTETPAEEQRFRMNYIRVPLQAIYFFGKYGDAVRPKVSLGPSLGFLVGGTNAYYDNDGNKLRETKASDIVESFDIGATAAAGVNIRLAPTVWLNTDIGYYHGFLDVAKASSSSHSANRNIALNVGVTFGIGTVKAAK